MLKVPSERPVGKTTVAILRLVDELVTGRRAEYFLIGATARDILLFHVFGIPATRATNDVDFAIALESWEQFEGIKALLLQTGRFTADRESAHRLFYDLESYGYGYPLNIIPFGRIEDGTNHIAWPPDKAIVMNVVGYEDALHATVRVEVADDFVLKVVSIPALAALKLFAWADRGRKNRKDAEDLYFLLKQYASAGNLGRLYEDAFDLAEESGFDVDLAGAALLGRDCREMMGAAALDRMRELLGDETTRNRLVLHMRATNEDVGNGAIQWLQQFEQGLNREPPTADIVVDHKG